MARGDDEFVEFVRNSATRLQHAAFLLTSDRHQAEDAAQTALAKTYAAWSRVRRKDAYAYARQVLVNHIIDGWRRPIRENATEDIPEQPSGLDVAGAVVQRKWLLDALRTLTDRERAVVVLRHFFDLKESDVAGELGVSVGTVKSTNSRALTKLRITAEDGTELIGGLGR
ncbi:SigE family RNA polymerase sigma factor [Amycolatopsis sp. WAC 01375]|uniref:SigE family RNA polymerase sigma factor n=1 Tax=unclassified Amycolatopsis TaxID=2618356 RepID=UPI000F7783A6|nr:MULTISPECIES: SigE family RNA polymerase sigma factor [unclassified Amycolatopsis]RSM83461.1 SigE family RNA polymerase sigma factor [Amycolatopsis sp. WAC 01375]RSN38316.1 SigE family RNA polymerase sigma factor [Amycolatopsis sp. WAC 01416]